MLLRWVKPEYAQLCTDFLYRVQSGEFRCLRELVAGLRDLVHAKLGGVVWWTEGRRDFEVTIAVPTGRRKDLEAFASDAEVREVLRSMTVSPVACKRVEKQGGGVFREFASLKLPRLHQAYVGRGIGFVCLVDRGIYASPESALVQLDLEPLSGIIDTWAWRINHHRRQMGAAFQRLADQHIVGTQRDESWRAVNAGVACLHRTLSVRELVDIASAAARSDPMRSGVLPEVLKDTLGRDLKEWHHCAPPRWPACDGGDGAPRELGRTLAYWSWWRDTDAHAGDTCIEVVRGPNEGHPDQGDKGMCRHVRRRLRGFRVQAERLRRVALSSVYRHRGASEVPLGELASKGLFSFFLSRLLDRDDGARPRYWTSEAPSPGELATALSSVARTAHYVLGDLPIDDSTIQSMIWMLSEYAHHTLGVPERIDLRTHLLQAARGEPALHALKNYYRDHFFHALEVCFMGHFLLECELKNRRRLWELVADGIPGQHSRNHVLRLWYIASLLHDLGYGIDVLKGVQHLLKFFQNATPLKQLARDLGLSLGALSRQLGNGESFVGYSAADKPGEDHGVVAARHLSSLLERIGADESEVEPGTYEPAVRAIAMHNSRKHTVTFKRDPLAFLLILCDTIQEWSRPRLSFATAPAQILARLMEHGLSEESLTGPLETVRLNVDRDDDSFRLAGGQDKLVLQLEYGDDIRWNAGVFNVWLDATDSFQRLDFEGLSEQFDIEVRYHTPQFRKVAGGPAERQLYRLRDAAYETHMAFLEHWFPTEEKDGRLTNGAVTYVAEGGEDSPHPMEHLTLHLRELCKRRPITRGIDAFRERLAKWRRYNEDREFAGDYAAPESVG